MNMLRKHPSALWVGGAVFLAASLGFGGLQVASATSPTPSVTANQGTAGATSWPVRVTNLPGTQPVSGTVSVSNLPSTLQVEGSSGVPTGGSEGSRSLDAGATDSTGPLDVSMFRGIRIFALCAGPAVGDCSSVQITVSATPNFSDPNAATYLLDQYNLPDLGPGHTSDDTRVEDIPGTQIDLTVTNNSPDPVIIAYTIVGHTN